jgi:hypothetical protein
VAFVVVFLAFHLPYLPQSLEDVDSINFALGLHAFDVTRHQPHPPGYPLFIAIAKGMRLLVASDARALALVGVMAGACGVVAMAALFRRLGGGLLALALAVTAPLYWFTTNRPLSDMTGLAAAIGVQVLILGATTTRGFVVAALCAGLVVGLRSQAFWLTAPLLTWRLVAGNWSLVERRDDPAASRQLPAAGLTYLAGLALWAVPLVWLTGGPRAYWHAVFDQGAEDLSGIRMFWTTPTVRELVDALYYAFVAPWAIWQLATAVLLLAAFGGVVLWRRDRAALALVAIAFGPYLLFDLLFQETFTSRYALPLVIPVALVAARGAAVLPAYAGVAVAIAAAMFGAHVGGTSLAAYARQPAPAFRLLADMARTPTPAASPPVFAMDRREAFDLRAPLKYLGGPVPHVELTLPSPAQHESFEVMKYFVDDGHLPVWFVADPKRTDIDAIQHGDPQQYRWSLPYPVLLDGTRPSEMDWYELDRPEWLVEDGWALTPEMAGVAEADHRGLIAGPIHGRVRNDIVRGFVMIGGRNFDPTARPDVTVEIGDSWSQTFTAPPGAFLHAWAVGRLGMPATRREYLPLTVRSDRPVYLAIEQFDASATRTLAGFGPGWHEQEYNPQSGLRWRWVSEHGEVELTWRTQAMDNSAIASAGAILRVDGESPRKYFPRGSRLIIRADGQMIFDEILSSDFSLHVPIARPAKTLTFDVDQFYVPAERSRWTRDRRHLALRIFRCAIVPVSSPGT